jgi:AraC-like DNA-binding protein
MTDQLLMSTTNLEASLGSLDVRLKAFAVCEIEAGWSLKCDPMDDLVVHYVLKGEGRVESAGGTIPISPGMIVVVPRFTAKSISAGAAVHRVVDAAGCCTEWIPGMVKFRANDSGADLIMACGSVEATVSGGVALFEHLQNPLAEAPENERSVRALFDVIIDDLANPGLGTKIIIEAMMKQSLVFLLRTHLRRLGLASPLFMPLVDPRLKECVFSILDRPQAAHSVGSLARMAGMSESRFATRFSQSYGKTPLEFVQMARVRGAADLLRTSDLPLKAIALAVGYSSRSHLSRVFRRHFGIDPTGYRRQGSVPSKSEGIADKAA